MPVCKSLKSILVFLLAAIPITGFSKDWVIDGILDEIEWSTAYSQSGFLLTSPYTLAPANEQTVAKLYADKSGLHVGFINQQRRPSPSFISLKDEALRTDYNEIIVDFDGLGVRAFGFRVSHANDSQDSVWSDENREDTDWDGNWQHATHQANGQWTTEILIPWSVASSYTRNVESINVYFSRWNQSEQNRQSFPAIDRDKQSFLSDFTSVPLSPSDSTATDLYPYFSAAKDFVRGNDISTTSGVDIFWKPSNSIQLDLSINPDFGQVENDAIAVNLTAIETFNEEKRPFFRQNHDLFDLQGPESLRLIHTPRIGGAIDDSTATPEIAGAARYTQLFQNYDLGFMFATEEDEDAVDGRDFFAARIRRKGDNFLIGGLLSHVYQPFESREATVAALDLSTKLSEQLRVSSQLIHSSIERDGTPRREDIGTWLSVEHEINDHWEHELTVFHYGRDLELNDFGYVTRVNREQLEYSNEYQINELSNPLVEFIVIETELEYRTTEDNQHLPTQIGGLLEFNSSHSGMLFLGAEYNTSGVDDLINPDGYSPRLSRFYELSAGYIDETQDRLHYELSVTSGKTGLWGAFHQIDFSPEIRISETFNIGASATYKKSDSWLILLDTNYLGDYTSRELELGLNFTLQSGPHELRWKTEAISINAVNNNTYIVGETGQLAVDGRDKDLFISEFATQIRYRYDLGNQSEIYIVYARGGEAEEDELRPASIRSFNSAISKENAERLLFKIKLHY
ncbi:hypothetical protein DOK_10942 [gamma proteobacterium BDW918]|uniref:DUF5916 domain-containing protein n=1 Tax=Zhongshania aliphaticivorans TaxID=1470434 RepID=A0A127M568_9GAMM|nr:DUF5916 domain-containing protein [Zhongshania aliphaticivorans]AMO68404.1 hypothetical protein AZF00_08850 [Zhongshania aliphaticivorans]EIF43038.1 hypothetical protein DOK_10942 [gamma proteobacterium BDW918]